MKSDFSYIRYYGTDLTTPLLERSIIYSDQLKEDFLSMMYGDFSGAEYAPPSLLMDSATGLTDNQLSILAEVGVFQFGDDSGSYDKDLYTYIESSKIVVLNIPPEVLEIRLFEDEESEEPIQIINLIDVIRNTIKVNKLMIFVSSSKSLNNLSPLIHEHSIKPHEEMDLYILTYNKLKEILSEKVITDDNLHTPSNIKLGDKEEDYEIEFPKSIIVNSGELHIVE